MHSRERPDAEKISDALRVFLAGASPPSDWWTRFAYHFTDLTNAIGILTSGALYSRNMARSLGLMANDNADGSVIAQSAGSHDWARLYFRPKTPTQYNNEGIQPHAHRHSGHCPVPIFFLFDLESVLRREGTEFSAGGMNKRKQPRVYDTPAALRSTLPANEIYSYGRYNPSTHGHIKDRRHAEILLPDPLPLKPYLKVIVCRSVAERETLLAMLPAPTRRQYESSIRLGPKGDLFERQWPHVVAVDLAKAADSGSATLSILTFRFWPDYKAKGSYSYEVKIVDIETEVTYKASGTHDYVRSQSLAIAFPAEVRELAVTLRIDGCVAFKGIRTSQSLFD
jgi:hypothetical protein